METTIENVLDLSEMCHACLSTDNKRLLKCDVDEHFLNIYRTCTNLKLKEGETLSFCELCVRQTEEFYKFREMCHQSHATIRTILTKTNQVIVCDENEAKSNEISCEEIKIECDPLMAEEDNPPKLEIQETQSQTYSFKCIICFETFKDFTSLGKHNKVTHSTNDYRCTICDETFNNPLLLAEHIKSHKDVDNTKIFGCGRCDKSYVALAGLQVHVYSHLGLKPYKCEFCSKGFTKLNSLKMHVNIHLHTEIYLCAECGKEFNSSALLKRHHQTTHSDVRPFQCDRCPSAFAVVRDLKQHLRIHTGEKPFLCPTCGKAFRRMNHLTVHKRIHTGEKPYKCSYCDRAFTQSGDWKAHERLHTGERPYVCKICTSSFNQSSALTTHIKRHNKKFVTKLIPTTFIGKPLKVYRGKNLQIISVPATASK